MRASRRRHVTYHNVPYLLYYIIPMLFTQIWGSLGLIVIVIIIIIMSSTTVILQHDIT